MTNLTNPFIMGSIVDLNMVRSSESGPGPVQVGTIFPASNGGEYMYLRLNAAINPVKRGRFVAIKTNTSCGPLTTALAVEGMPLGVAHKDVSSGQYAFFCVKGRTACLTGSSGFNVNLPLFVDANEAGCLATTTGTLTYVTGVAPLADIAASTSSAFVWLTHPTVQRYGFSSGA